jgi:cell division septum initiation protein DivIVA
MSDPHRDMMPMHEAQHSFDVVLRGYDRNQVAETIERLEADFRIAIADRDAATARSSDLASQLSAMHGEIESLRR